MQTYILRQLLSQLTLSTARSSISLPAGKADSEKYSAMLSLTRSLSLPHRQMLLRQSATLSINEAATACSTSEKGRFSTVPLPSPPKRVSRMEKASCRSRTTAMVQPAPCRTAAGDVRTASVRSCATQEDISSACTTTLFLSALVSRSELDEANALMKSETAVRIFGKYFIKYRVILQTFLLIIYI